MRPKFCTEEPAFMGGVFHSDEEVRQQKLSLFGKPTLEHRIHRIYFHRKMEGILGYDIVNHVDGHIPTLKENCRVECDCITPFGSTVEGVMVARWRDDKVSCYIVVPEEAELAYNDLQESPGVLGC